MPYAMKNKKSIVTAYQLGAGSAVEERLKAEGAIRLLPDGSYELFSQESKNMSGEIAFCGDYFKVDNVGGKHFPYPIKKVWFEANHEHIVGDGYIQKAKPLKIWECYSPMIEEMAFLFDEKRIEIREDDEKVYYQAFHGGTRLSASKDAVVVFYEVTRDCSGKIIDIDFNFVARCEFEKNYVYCEGSG